MSGFRRQGYICHGLCLSGEYAPGQPDSLLQSPGVHLPVICLSRATPLGELGTTTSSFPSGICRCTTASIYACQGLHHSRSCAPRLPASPLESPGERLSGWEGGTSPMQNPPEVRWQSRLHQHCVIHVLSDTAFNAGRAGSCGSVLLE